MRIPAWCGWRSSPRIERVAGCDLLWRRDLGQFTATSDCGLRAQLDPNGLWIGWDGDKPLNELSRARIFSCYVDIPGVAGGRDEPFDRYAIERLHDQGDLQWIEPRDGRRIGITLRNVQWPMNNELDAFTRNSLVMYVIERTDEGIKTHTYGWTEPRARAHRPEPAMAAGELLPGIQSRRAALLRWKSLAPYSRRAGCWPAMLRSR